MIFQIASDLHLEHLKSKWPSERLIVPNPNADILILAGDIANGTLAFKLFANWPVPIIYVAGNHEFYENSEPDMRLRMRQCAAETSIHFLENEAVVIGGIRFLGTTLWTDYKLTRGSTQNQLMAVAQTKIHDHSLIRCGGARFSPQDALARHMQARSWLESESAKPFAGKTVVISHHAPHPLSVHPRFENEPLTSAFVSDMSDLLHNANLWVHGHVHDGFSYQVGSCRVIANPCGYVMNRATAKSSESFQFENKKFDRKFVFNLSNISI